MRTHYHLLLETPEANLVKGMKWFQGTFTQRLNALQQTWGHVYQGRYKAKVIDPEDPEYFRSVATYIHLNPVAAGMVSAAKPLSDYAWSSYPDYLRAPSRRRPWLQTARVLSSAGVPTDSPRGRKAFGAYMEMRRKEAEAALQGRDGRRDWARMERGWVHGAKAFREQMLKLLEEEGGFARGRVEDGEQLRDHGERGARAAIEACLPLLGLSLAELRALRKGDERKALVGGWIKARHAVSNRWISEALNMGDRARVSRSTGVFRSPPPHLRALARRLRECQTS